MLPRAKPYARCSPHTTSVKRIRPHEPGIAVFVPSAGWTKDNQRGWVTCLRPQNLDLTTGLAAPKAQAVAKVPASLIAESPSCET